MVAKRLIGLRLVHTLLDVMPFMLISAGVMTATYFCTFWISSHPIILVARIAIAAPLYIAATKLLHPEILTETLAYLHPHQKVVIYPELALKNTQIPSKKSIST